MTTIGTAIIVKNEAAVIRRCLASLMSMVDYFLIVDTGSTDGTQRVIRDFLSEHRLRGEVIEQPWKDFAHNRTQALSHLRARREIDYTFVIDADDELVLEEGFDPKRFKSGMDRDLYDVVIQYGASRYHRPQILRNSMGFFYRGVLHEFVEGPPQGFSRADAAGFHIRIRGGGARSQDPAKFARDAAALERALETETDAFLRSRYTFYLAQSYRDCGEKQKAFDNYLKRAGQGFWIEEVFVSLYEAAKLRAALGHPPEEVIATFLAASAAIPARAEALHGASRYCREIKRNAEALEYARRGAALPQPGAGLFVETWIYDYGLLDEVAINAYWTGDYRGSLDACQALLASGKLPASEVERVTANAKRAEAELSARGGAAAKGREAQSFQGWSTSRYGRWSVHPPLARTEQAAERAEIQRLLQEVGTALLFGGDSAAAIQRLVSGGCPEDEAQRIVATAISDPLILNGREMARQLRKRDWLLAALEQQQRLWPPAAQIERRTRLASNEFLERYYARARPVILAGEMYQWSAVHKWTPSYLARVIGRYEIECRVEQAGRNAGGKSTAQRRMPFESFVRLATEGGDGVYMLADETSLNPAVFGWLNGDLGILDAFVDRDQPGSGGTLWIGSSDVLTPLHHEITNCLIAQIAGRNRFKIVAASEAAHLHNYHGTLSELRDLDTPNLEQRFPALANLPVLDVTLEPGEVLFVPLGWWYQVRSTGFTANATFTAFRWPNDAFRSYPGR